MPRVYDGIQVPRMCPNCGKPPAYTYAAYGHWYSCCHYEGAPASNPAAAREAWNQMLLVLTGPERDPYGRAVVATAPVLAPTTGRITSSTPAEPDPYGRDAVYIIKPIRSTIYFEMPICRRCNTTAVRIVTEPDRRSVCPKCDAPESRLEWARDLTTPALVIHGDDQSEPP